VVTVGVLGSMRVEVDGVDVSPQAPKSRSLVALLAIHAGNVVSSDRLIDELWPELEVDRARRVLWVRIAELRAGLRRGGADEVLVSAAPGYCLAIAPEAVDSGRFAALVSDAAAHRTSGDHLAAARVLRDALAIWRGPPLDDAQGCLALEAEARRLADAYVDAAEEWLDAELRCGRHIQVLPTARRLVAEHPLHERLSTHLARCLDRAGRSAEAVRVCRELRARLATELGLDVGDEVDRLERELTCPRLPADVARSVRLPLALTRFVGRQRELSEVAALWAEHRVVTLTGVGGVGKTRLAVQSAANRLDRHGDGVRLVELAPLRDDDAVAGAVATELGLGVAGEPDETIDAVAAWIGGRSLALVLDNAEHVATGTGRVTHRLLVACPNLSVLATSRVALHVPGEVVYSVPPMGIGGDGETGDAVTLFVERAEAARPSAPLSAAERVAAVDVCRRLDGIPLAIELAAARVRMISVDQLAGRLEDVLPVLSGNGGDAPDRHRTMRAALDWSHQLLTPDERAALRRLAVFAGEFDLEAAIAVLGGVGPLEESTTDGFSLVADLVDRSWIELTACGTRYRVLEPVRQYAAERLAAAGETAAARWAHRDVYLHRCRPMWPLMTAQQRRRAYADRSNIRAATEWSWENDDAGAALGLVVFQADCWMLSGDAQVRMWLERVLVHPQVASHELRCRALNLLVLTLADCGEGKSPRLPDLIAEASALAADVVDPIERASVELILVEWALSRGDFAEARARTEAAMDVYARDRIVAGVAWCQHYLGWLALADGDIVGARRTFELSVDLARDDRGGEWLLPHALAALAPVAAVLGDGDQACRLATDAVDAARPFDVRAVLAMALCRSAEARVIAGDDDGTAADVVELLRLLRELGTRRWLADIVELAAVVLARRGLPVDAATALGTADGLRSAAGEPLGGVRVSAEEVRRTVTAVEAALAPVELRRARAAGRAVAPEAAVVHLLATL
jgi:predicted ATPase/DNA-binding SARP family transcriptional activator